MYSIVLYCSVLFCIVLYCIVLYCIVQYNTVQYRTREHTTVQHNTAQYNTIQYNTTQYITVQYSAVQYCKFNTIQYSQPAIQPDSQTASQPASLAQYNQAAKMCLARPSQEFMRIGFFRFYGTAHPFGWFLNQNLGQLRQNAWFSKEVRHSCKVQGPNQNRTYSYEGGAGTVARVCGICFWGVLGQCIVFCYFYENHMLHFKKLGLYIIFN